MAKQKNKLGIRKPRTAEEQIASLKNLIRAIDPPREPVVAVSRNSIRTDGFVPSWVWVKVMELAEKNNVRREALQARRGARGKIKNRILSWIPGQARNNERGMADVA